MGFTDDDLARLQQEILENPQRGAIIKETGGLRKMRFALEGRGKRGSARVTYVDFLIYDTVYLIYAYEKKEKDNLTNDEKNKIKKMLSQIENALKEGSQ